MPSARFTGFPDGSSVTLSAAKGGVTKGPLTISAWKQSGGVEKGEIDITAIRMDGTIQTSGYTSPADVNAPDAVLFEAEVTSATGLIAPVDGYVRSHPEGNFDVPKATARYSHTHADGTFTWDQQMHELEFVWSFGGTTGNFDASDRLPSIFADKSVAHGKKTFHVFETPGTHDVTCEVYRVNHSGGTQTVTLIARKTIQIEVRDIALDYPDHLTVCINPAFPAGWTDNCHTLDAECPTGATGYPDFATYRADWPTRYGVEHRVLFKSGQTHEWDSSRYFTGANHLFLGAYGSDPARPRITLPAGYTDGAFITNNTTGVRNHWRFVDLDVEGPYDERTDTGDKVDFVGAPIVNKRIFVNCKFHGTNRVVRHHSDSLGWSAPEGGLAALFFNTDCTGYYSYISLFDGNPRAWFGGRGSCFRKSMDADWGSRGPGNGPNAPLRISKTGTTIFEACDFYNRTGWTGAAQPCLRMNVTGLYFDALLHYNIFEDSDQGLTTGPTNEDGGVTPANVLVKHNIFIYGPQTATGLTSARGGGSIIGNIIVAPNIGSGIADTSSNPPVINSRSRGEAIRFASWIEPTQLNKEFPCRVIGNTLLDYKTPDGSGDEMPVVDGLDGFEGLIEDHDNVRYAPDYSTPETATLGTAPPTGLTVTSRNTVAPRLKNTTTGDFVDFTGLSPDGLPWTTPGGEVDILRPDSDGTVVGAASVKSTRRDALGTERPADAASGAVEP